MNKKELIDKIESLPSLTSITSIRPYVDKKIVLGLISQLDESEKVVIPQFVADWIEEGKKHCKDVSDLFGFDFTNDEVGKWFTQERPFDLVARAWLDGYEVEKEKRYIIKLKGVPDGAKFLKYAKVIQEWYFGMRRHNSDIEVIHTHKELEEGGFGWVFDCEGVEVEEVE